MRLREKIAAIINVFCDNAAFDAMIAVLWLTVISLYVQIFFGFNFMMGYLFLSIYCLLYVLGFLLRHPDYQPGCLFDSWKNIYKPKKKV